MGWLASKPVNLILGKFFDGFNWVFDVTIKGYGVAVSMLLRTCVIGLVVYGGLMVLTFLGFRKAPTGFIPDQDKGYLVINAQLPDGASLERTDEVIQRLSKVVREVEGVAHTIDLAGYSTILSTNLSNVGGMFVILEPFEERAGIKELSAPVVMAKLRRAFRGISGGGDCRVRGAAGRRSRQHGRIQDAGAGRAARGCAALQGAVQNFAEQTRASPGLVGVFSTFSVAQPQLYVEIDREKVKAQNVSLDSVHTALQAYLGAAYVNDFSFQNRSWQVNIQADPQYRTRVDDIGNLEVRNGDGNIVPLRTLIRVLNTSGPSIVNRYNLYPSAELNGASAPGVSSASPSP